MTLFLLPESDIDEKSTSTEIFHKKLEPHAIWKKFEAHPLVDTLRTNS
jgi:hypothetical protein